MQQIMKLPYLTFVLLLPIISLGYFHGIFRNWSMNGSLYPLLLLAVIALVSFNKLEIPSYGQRKAFLTILFSFLAVTTVSTLGMSLYLDYAINYVGYEDFKQPLFNALKIMPRNIIVFSIFAIVFIIIKSINDIAITLKYLYTSFFIIIVYGYIQVLSIFDFGFFPKIYDFIWPIIDSGWAGENRDVPYIYGFPRRINLTMPEASEAAHYFQSAVFPFLIASIISRSSIYKGKIIGMRVEFCLFFISIPLLLFTISSSGYFVFFAQISLALLLYVRFYAAKIKFTKLLFIAITITAITALTVITTFYEEVAEIDTDILQKVFDIQNGSSNTRYALTLAGLGVFIKYPLFGVGPANTNLVIKEFIPEWAMNNYEITNAIQIKAIPILNYWVELLATTGVIGTAIYLWLMYKTIKPYIVLPASSDFNVFLKSSFYLYLLSTVMHGFNSSSMSFIYMWFIWAFYICLVTTKFSFAGYRQ